MEKEQNSDTTDNQKQPPPPTSSSSLALPKKSKMCPAPQKKNLTRKRNDLTIDIKLQIIEEFSNGVPINIILKKFNINQSHLSSIIRRKAAILQDFHTYGRKQRKRIAKRTKYAPINEEVFRWLMSLNCHVSGSIIQNKAKTFAEKLKITGFRASNGWLECFRKKYTIQSYKDLNNNAYNPQSNPPNNREGNDKTDSPSSNHTQQPFNSSTNSVVDDINNRSMENGFNIRSTSNESLVSATIHQKSPQNYYAQPSNGVNNRNGNCYRPMYHQQNLPQSNFQAISQMGSTRMGPGVVPHSGVTNDCYSVDNTNANNLMKNLVPKQEHSMLPHPSGYHSVSAENLPTHHMYNKPSHQTNPNNGRDIYGYHPSSYTKTNQMGSDHYGEFHPPPPDNRMHPTSYQNQNNANGVVNALHSFEPNHMLYPLGQISTNETNFSSVPTMHMKPFMSEFNELVPNVSSGGHFQPPPPLPTMHGNFHTPNVAATNWNDPLATLPSYSVDLTSNLTPNVSATPHYSRAADPTNVNPSAMGGHPYNQMNRNHPPFRPDQQKDFY